MAFNTNTRFIGSYVARHTRYPYNLVSSIGLEVYENPQVLPTKIIDEPKKKMGVRHVTPPPQKKKEKKKERKQSFFTLLDLLFKYIFFNVWNIILLR